MVHCSSLTIATPGRTMVDITQSVDELVRASGIKEGLCHIFVHHTSASLTITENADPDVLSDLEGFFKRSVPDGDPCYAHRSEGPDDMSSHIRNILTQTFLMVPVREGHISLGRWQGLFLWEHRDTPHQRRISVTVMA